MEKALIVALLLSLTLMAKLGYSQAQGNQEISPKVLAVFPSSDSLPENLLRLYIHFSKPMKTIGNLEKIKLRDEAGREVDGAIFNHVFELWNQEQTQLTLLLDPARVKTGLRAHEERGRALQAGKNYELHIGSLEDVDGGMTQAFTKSFYVIKEDKRAPNKALWTFRLPPAGSKSPLLIRFPQMLDRLSLLQRLKLTDKNNQPIAGQIEIGQGESEWRLIPHKT
ncbi:MAG: hypothetical protein AAFU64_01975, partial [Bacteroidota bacterium]